MAGLVYSYTRFSDPRQAGGNSSERQTALAAQWAASRGMKLDASLSMHDEGLSAYHQKHVKSGALGVFLGAIEAGRIPRGSYLLVEQFDRLSRRTPMEAFRQFSDIIAAGITIVTTKDQKEWSAAGIEKNPFGLFESIMPMILANQESANKSKRVVASIRKLCERWVDGSYRGIIRNGKDPAWVELVDGKFKLIPERVEAARVGLDLYRNGYSARRIVSELKNRKLMLTDRGAEALQIYRLVHQRALIGEKELTVDGVSFQLKGYYPAIMKMAEWQDLQTMVSGRGRRAAKGPVPHILTGMKMTVCGYCNRAMVGQNIGTRNRREDGGIMDGHRRLHCTGYACSTPCPVPGSCSVAPIERALIGYCSDAHNLRALYGTDRSGSLRAKVTAAREKVAGFAAKLERAMDVMLSADSSGSRPDTLVKRMRELEKQKEIAVNEVEAAERELASAARPENAGADKQWRAIAAGVESQDVDARLRARQLIADTFERITVYHRGMRPKQGTGIDVVVLARGGVERWIHIDPDGEWTTVEHKHGALPQFPARAKRATVPA